MKVVLITAAIVGGLFTSPLIYAEYNKCVVWGTTQATTEKGSGDSCTITTYSDGAGEKAKRGPDSCAVLKSKDCSVAGAYGGQKIVQNGYWAGGKCNPYAGEVTVTGFSIPRRTGDPCDGKTTNPPVED